MKYEVLVGVHIQGRKVYKKGDVIDTDAPLAKLFPKKFREVVPTSKTRSVTDSATPSSKKPTEATKSKG